MVEYVKTMYLLGNLINRYLVLNVPLYVCVCIYPQKC